MYVDGFKYRVGGAFACFVKGPPDVFSYHTDHNHLDTARNEEYHHERSPALRRCVLNESVNKEIRRKYKADEGKEESG